MVVGFGRLNGAVIGVVGNNSMFKGGVLFVDSADKATRFIQLCDAFNVPLLFLSDVPGFMVAPRSRSGHHPSGAKMISAVAEATVPKICVVVRKAYGAGLYAMADPDLPRRHAGAAHGEDRGDGRGGGRQCRLRQQDRIDRDSAERDAFVKAKREEYDEDIDIVRLASELVVDSVVEPHRLRDELIHALRPLAARTAPSPGGVMA